ncbi:uncharacterized protein LOC114542175 [Dendronephthya gigantea]|uniref:uncharacterized protein LOC114542175 n=1 Tax=Dendronephthya gigantea TaxID=151771 RepID=UPI00106CEB7B|nr:uncharacterized protein LOC114542175 [Dendronephthya gigantea]
MKDNVLGANVRLQEPFVSIKNDPGKCVKRHLGKNVYLLLFSLVTLLASSSIVNGMKFCFDGNNEGRRLNATVLTSCYTQSAAKCVLQCSNEPCCRSVNYHKTSSGECLIENCELLHAISTENPQYLVEDKDFDYFILLPQPEREFNCQCMSCQSDIEECSQVNKNCSCLYGQDELKCGKKDLAPSDCSDESPSQACHGWKASCGSNIIVQRSCKKTCGLC